MFVLVCAWICLIITTLSLLLQINETKSIGEVILVALVNLPFVVVIIDSILRAHGS